MSSVLAASTPTAFGGSHVLDNTIRLFIIIVGISLAMVCARLAINYLMRTDWYAACAALSAGFLAVTPSISGLLRFGQPLQVQTTITYMLGLVFGAIAGARYVTLRGAWSRRRSPSRRNDDPSRRGARRK